MPVLAPDASFPSSPGPEPTRQLRILVADDEGAVREVLEIYLAGDGHEVELAVDGQDAWERFQQGAWDVVMTDRAMPRMNGFQLAAAVKQAQPATPVIMVTGFASDLPSDPAERDAVDVLVRKPFTLDSLRTALAQVAA